jgi:hypothetical protein
MQPPTMFFGKIKSEEQVHSQTFTERVHEGPQRYYQASSLLTGRRPAQWPKSSVDSAFLYE